MLATWCPACEYLTSRRLLCTVQTQRPEQCWRSARRQGDSERGQGWLSGNAGCAGNGSASCCCWLCNEAHLLSSTERKGVCRRARSGNHHDHRRHGGGSPVSYTHLRAHETRHDLVCR